MRNMTRVHLCTSRHAASSPDPTPVTLIRALTSTISLNHLYPCLVVNLTWVLWLQLGLGQATMLALGQVTITEADELG